MPRLMYRECPHKINAFVGCGFGCVYCEPSFQRMCKWSKCPLHKSYIPHSHLERLEKRPPKTARNEFIFFPSSGDLAFATPEIIEKHIEYAKTWADRLFLIQSKDTGWMRNYNFPDNVILGTTLETNRVFFSTPSPYGSYDEISLAPHPLRRVEYFSSFFHPIKLVAIEPILQFHLNKMISMLKKIRNSCKNLIVYIGYDNHRCQLPEPTLQETETLIKKLEALNFNIRIKTLRKAWYEG